MYLLLPVLRQLGRVLGFVSLWALYVTSEALRESGVWETPDSS